LEEEILELLTESPNITTTEIAERLGRSRTRIIHYLKILESNKIVSYDRAGPAKLWHIIDKEAEKFKLKNQGTEVSEGLNEFLETAFKLEIFTESEIKELIEARKTILEKIEG